ncbi:MAG: ATP synthase subunit I [Deltaproteobacteria bacterium]|jgi:hypothetical protein|nr:ATP synthase subunit I [Deltaproteobacteria bacterium]
MATTLEQLPAQLTRRNWIVLALLMGVSLPFGNASLLLGILCGGLVSAGGFLWMQRSLEKLIANPSGGARYRYQFGYLIRLIVLAVLLGALIAIVEVNLVGLMIGLSVVIINLFWLALQRALK